MPERLSYTDRNKILQSRVAFVNYVQNKKLINEGKRIGLNIFPPNQDASHVPIIHNAAVYTTPTELTRYLAEVSDTPGVEPTEGPSVPNAPLSLCVIPSDSSLTIFFIPSSDGGSPITNYKYSTDGTTFVDFSPAQTTSPIIISSLINGTVYTVYLKAVNSVGASTTSSSITAAPIPSSFDPTVISGLNLWLDGQNITKVLTTEGEVTGWDDTSSAENNFIRGGSGIITYDMPSNVNNRPALNFTTASGTYLSRECNITPNDQLSLFIVLKQTDTGSGNSELFYTRNNYRYFDLFNRTNSDGVLSLNARSENQVSTGLNIITDSPIVIISVFLSSISAVFVNGQPTDIFDNGSFAGLSLNSEFEWAISGGAFIGYVCEVITYSSIVSEQERKKIEAYLAWKWGLQSNLPNDNEWQLLPPSNEEVPVSPVLIYILAANNSAYVYYTQVTTYPVTNYEYSIDGNTTFINSNPVDIKSPLIVRDLLNVEYNIALRAYNNEGTSSISNELLIAPSNEPLPEAWLFFDPNNVSSYSGSGPTVSNIGSYGALNGTINGSLPYRRGTGIETNIFNFGSGHITFGQVDFGDNFTISAWIYPSARASINAILTNGSANVNTAGFKFGWNTWNTSDRRLMFENGDGTAGNWQVPTSVNDTVTMGTWQYVTVIFDRTNRISVFLVNGIPVNVESISTATNVSVNRPNFNIGAYLGGSYRMNAELGLLKVFNSSLTASQVLADYNATCARFGFTPDE